MPCCCSPKLVHQDSPALTWYFISGQASCITVADSRQTLPPAWSSSLPVLLSTPPHCTACHGWLLLQTGQGSYLHCQDALYLLPGVSIFHLKVICAGVYKMLIWILPGKLTLDPALVFGSCHNFFPPQEIYNFFPYFKILPPHDYHPPPVFQKFTSSRLSPLFQWSTSSQLRIMKILPQKNQSCQGNNILSKKGNLAGDGFPHKMKNRHPCLLQYGSQLTDLLLWHMLTLGVTRACRDQCLDANLFPWFSARSPRPPNHFQSPVSYSWAPEYSQ